MKTILIVFLSIGVAGCTIHRKAQLEAVSASESASRYAITTKEEVFDLVAHSNGRYGLISEGDLIVIRNPSCDLIIDGKQLHAGGTREILLDRPGVTVSVFHMKNYGKSYSFDMEIVKTGGSFPPTKIWQIIDDGL